MLKVDTQIQKLRMMGIEVVASTDWAHIIRPQGEKLGIYHNNFGLVSEAKYDNYKVVGEFILLHEITKHPSVACKAVALTTIYTKHQPDELPPISNEKLTLLRKPNEQVIVYEQTFINGNILCKALNSSGEVRDISRY